jgi:hypothetical protein
MAAKRIQNAQTNCMKTNTGRKLKLPCCATGDAWNVGDYHADTQSDTAGVVAYDSVVELEHIMERTRFYDHDSTDSSDVRSIGSSLTCDTSAASTEADHGSVSYRTSTQNTSSWATVPSLKSHGKGSGRIHSDDSTVSTGQGPSRFNYTYLGGDVAEPSPLDRWKGTFEPHEDLAYRLERPPARKRSAGKKRH